MRKVTVQSEVISKIGRFVYMKLFDDFGNIKLNQYENFCDKNGDYSCKKIFWRFYWIFEANYYN